MQKEFDALKRFLDKNIVEYHVSEHEPVFTSEQAAHVRGVELKTGVKSLIFKTEDEKFIDALVAADKKIDAKKLSDIIGKKVKLATSDEVLRVCKCEIGSVHPFGNLFGLKTYMDKGILENEEINFNAGLHEFSIRMKSRDLLNMLKPVLGEFSL